MNIEADSLNSVLLGPDVAPDSPEFGFFAREVMREMTAKAGQKCTAIRRILVPQDKAQAAIDAIAALLKTVVVGDPANAASSMGPLVNMTQRKSVEEGIAKLKTQADVAYTPENFKANEADTERGAFVPPTLLKVRDSGNADVIHEVEVFGPVATVVPYRDKHDAFALARRGGGSLAASVYSGDAAFLAEAGVALGTTHGRVMLIDPSIGDSHTGHGNRICRRACTAGRGAPAAARNWAACTGCGSIISAWRCRARVLHCQRSRLRALILRNDIGRDHRTNRCYGRGQEAGDDVDPAESRHTADNCHAA